LADAAEDRLGGAVLQQVALGTGIERGQNALVLAERGQHEHVSAGVLGDDAPGGGDPVRARHRQIHQDDVRAQLRRHRDTFFAVGRTSHRVEIIGGGQ